MMDIGAIIAEVNSIRIGPELSDADIKALVRIYVSLYDCSVVLPDGHLLPHGADYGEKIDELFGECRLRGASGQPVSRRALIVPVMYELLYSTMRGLSPEQADICRRYMHETVAEWLENREEVPETGILRIICDMLCYSDPGARASDERFILFKKTVAEWAAELDGAGCWPDIETGEALGRLDILSRNGSVFLDTAHERTTEAARGHYFRLLTARDGNDMRIGELFMLYDIVVWGTVLPDMEKAGRIAEIASELLGAHSAGDSDRLTLLAILTDCHCKMALEKI